MTYIIFRDQQPTRVSLMETILHASFMKRKSEMGPIYEGRPESKERFVIQRYLLITGKKENMQVLSHTFTYFST
jgi:hypothetical protein